MDFDNFNENRSLPLLLDRSNRLLTKNLRRIFASRGYTITAEQWMILLLLWQKNGRSQQEIADCIGKDKSTVSPQIDGLEKRNLILRVPDRKDNRRNFVWLTRKGKTLEDALIPLGFANIELAQDGISEMDLNTCKRVLRTICGNLEQAELSAGKFTAKITKDCKQ